MTEAAAETTAAPQAQAVPAAAAAPADKAAAPAKEAAAADEQLDLLGDVPAKEEPAKPAEEKKDDEEDLLEGKVGEEKTEPSADDEYGEFTIPEGYEANKELADFSKPVFKEIGLSKDQAQALVEKLGPKILSAYGEKAAEQWKATQRNWAAEAKKDDTVFDAAAKAVRPEVALGRDYLGAEFTAAIKQLGGSNHPAVLKALAKVGQALGEDTPGFGKAPGRAKSPAEILYPNNI